MPLVPAGPLVKKAFSERWALGAFNTSNLELTQGIAWALGSERAPGIMQTSEKAIEYADLETLFGIVKNVAEDADVPIAIHLDHGKSLEMVERCLNAGYLSVMFDGSALPFAENIKMTREAAKMAHSKGAFIEGELGALAGKEGDLGGKKVDEAQFTDPKMAEEFVAKTAVDSLAVSVGTIHGLYRGEEKIRFEILREIQRAVPVPLVLHGASGLPNSELIRALKFGVAKVNIDTELREAFKEGAEAGLKNTGGLDPRKIMAPAREGVRRVVLEKVQTLGGCGRA